MIHDGRMDLAYFWSSVLIVLLPLGVFVALAVLTTRAYFRRKAADGGGPPPRKEQGAGSSS